MDHVPALDAAGKPVLNANGDQQTAVAPTTEENQERVKGKWGEDLNTAFQYEKYTGEQVSGGGNWASSAARYEWNDQFETQDVAPRDEMLERQLFGDENEGPMGINFDKYLTLYPTTLDFHLYRLPLGLWMTNGRYDKINVTYKSTEKVVPIMKVPPKHSSHAHDV